MRLLNKFIAFLSLFLILFGQMSAPLAVLAQETTESALVQVEEPTPNPSETSIPSTEPEVSPTLTETPSPIPEPSTSPQLDENLEVFSPITESAPVIDAAISENQPSATVTPEIWQSNEDSSITTINNVVLHQTYSAPQNSKVTVTFTKLPENPGKLTIQQISLTEQQIKETGALSSTAYDITSTMQDGTFEYTLTLPTPKTDNIEVKVSEDGQNFTTVGGVSTQENIVTITGLNHFTVFVVASPTAGTDASDVGTISWVNPGNVFSSNDSHATVDLASGNVSHYIKATNFGLSIPTNATIKGITVSTERKAASACNCTDSSVRLIKAGIIVGDNRSTATTYLTTDTNEDHGGSTDLWGTTWTPSDINDTNFGAAIAVTRTSGGGTKLVSIDHIQVTVHYNTPPVATDDNASTNEDTPVVIAAATLMTNDTDVDGDTKTITAVANPVNGTVSLSGTDITFTPTANYNGSSASFEYTLSDGTVTDTGLVNITVNPISDPPVANAQSVTTDEDTDKAITLGASDPDNDPITYIIVSNPTNGSLIGIGSFKTYTPSANYNGADSFTFKVNDGSMDSNAATVNIIVNAVNDTPSFDAISNQTINEDSSLQSFTVTNISPGPIDESGQTVTLSATSSNTSVIPNPSVNMLNPAELRYTPVANANGTATITVTANDAQAQNNTFDRTFTITVNAVNDNPAIALNSPNGGQIFAGGSTQNITWGASDVDSSDTLTIALDYTTDGSNFTNIASGLSNSGTYSWTVPSINSSTVKVRTTVSDATVTASDVSDANFTIDSDIPTDPTDVASTSHTTSPSNVNTIDIIWTAAGSAPGATDSASGVDGYSYSFTAVATDVPDTTKDAEETATSTSSSALSDGTWYFHLRTLDNAGNWTSTVHVGPFTINTGAPTLQNFSSSTANSTYGPGTNINVTATYNEALISGSTMTVVLDTGSSVVLSTISGSTLSGTYTVGATGSGQNSSDLTVSSITSQNVSDAAGNSQTSTSVPGTNIAGSSDIVVDTTSPTGTFTINSNATYTISTSVDLNFSGVSADVAQLEIRNGTVGSFQTPVAYTNPYAYILTSGDATKTVSVRFTDSVGNKSSGIISDTITLDTTKPATTIGSVTDGNTNPVTLNGVTSSNSISIAFSATDTNGIASSECKIDAGSYSGCTSTKSYSSLSDGTHTVSIRSTDNAGNVESTATFTWTVDTTTPDTTILTGPANPGNSATPGFTFSATETVSFECKIDSGSFAACTSPFTTPTLADGPHTFDVRAVDTAGNVDPSPASQAFTVDTQAPITTDNVDGLWHNTGVSVNLNCNDASGCDVIYWTTDGSTPTTGSSTGSSIFLTSDGIYTIKYFSVDNVGNVESVVTATNQVKIDATIPVTTDDSDGAWHNSAVTVNLVCVDTTSGCANTYYTTDGSDPTISGTVQTGTTINLSAEGIYDLNYYSEDNAGNPENVTTVLNAVKIDTTLPTEPVPSVPAGDYTSNQSVTLTSSDVNGYTIYYTTDGTVPSNVSTLYIGAITVDHSLTLKAIAYDPAGNPSSILSALYGIAPVISAEATSTVSDTSVTVTWTTDDLATSRVIYDTVSHAVLGAAPNYGYANSTVEDTTKVTSHSVTISGLTASTTYFYRTVSHGSPETVGSEKSVSTTAVAAASTSSTSGGGGGNNSGDGLGCAVKDCSGGYTAPLQNLVLGISTPQSPAVFTPGVLGVATQLGNIGLGEEEQGEVQGEATASAEEASTPTPEPQTTEGSSPFNFKVIAIIAILLLGGFGIFKFFVK